MKKESFFKAYYRNMKEINVSLIIIMALFVVIISGVTSYALFGSEVVGTKTISLTIGLPRTDDACFEVDSYGTLKNFKCYDNNPFGLNTVRDVVIPMTVNSVKVNEIGDFAFESKAINSVVIPTSVTKIGTYAFNYNNLKELKIPFSVSSIYDGAFSNNKLVSVTIYNKKDLNEFKKIGDDVFGFDSGFSNSNISFK